MKILLSHFQRTPCRTATSFLNLRSVARAPPWRPPQIINVQFAPCHSPPEKHSQHEVAVSLPFAVTIPSQRNVEIIAQPGTQADVPAAPEILHIFGEVGLAEFTMK